VVGHFYSLNNATCSHINWCVMYISSQNSDNLYVFSRFNACSNKCSQYMLGERVYPYIWFSNVLLTMLLYHVQDPFNSLCY